MIILVEMLRSQRAIVAQPRTRECSVSSNPAASGPSSEAPQTAAFVEKESSRPVLLLVVPSGRLAEVV
jgi:hypothetical protein